VIELTVLTIGRKAPAGNQSPVAEPFLFCRRCKMKTFYGVLAEIFNGRYSGTKQAVISKACKVKPKSSYREIYGKTAFRIWLENEEDANELCEGIRTGDIGVYTLLGLFEKVGAAA
jgi:hypothetical protein